jgi:hypothetical protein
MANFPFKQEKNQTTKETFSKKEEEITILRVISL